MKLKKLILIITTVLLFTGCSIEYNLDIDEKSMTEEIKVGYPNTEENKKNIESLLENPMAAYYNSNTDETGYYSIKSSKGYNKLYVTYNYKYSGNQLRNSNAVNRCYYKKNVINTDEVIVIETEGAFRCMYDDYSKLIDDVVITIKTDLKVEKNNADEVIGNRYIWKIDETNYKDKPIYMKIDKTKKSIFAYFIQFLTPILIIACPILVVGGIILIIKLKRDRVNKF